MRAPQRLPASFFGCGRQAGPSLSCCVLECAFSPASCGRCCSKLMGDGMEASNPEETLGEQYFSVLGCRAKTSATDCQAASLGSLLGQTGANKSPDPLTFPPTSSHLSSNRDLVTGRSMELSRYRLSLSIAGLGSAATFGRDLKTTGGVRLPFSLLPTAFPTSQHGCTLLAPYRDPDHLPRLE